MCVRSRVPYHGGCGYGGLAYGPSVPSGGLRAAQLFLSAGETACRRRRKCGFLTEEGVLEQIS